MSNSQAAIETEAAVKEYRRAMNVVEVYQNARKKFDEALERLGISREEAGLTVEDRDLEHLLEVKMRLMEHELRKDLVAKAQERKNCSSKPWRRAHAAA